MQAESVICSMAALINILSAEYPGNKIIIQSHIFFRNKEFNLGYYF